MVASNVAGDIKSANFGALGTEVAHAALGCGVGMVRSDSSDGCAPGAAGAVVAHMAAPLVFGAVYDPNNPGSAIQSANEASFYSSLLGGSVAALVGDNDAIESNFAIGQGTGQNAAANNALSGQFVDLAAVRLRSGCDAQCLSGLIEAGQRDIELTTAREEQAIAQGRGAAVLNSMGQTLERLDAAILNARTPEQVEFARAMKAYQLQEYQQLSARLSAHEQIASELMGMLSAAGGGKGGMSVGSTTKPSVISSNTRSTLDPSTQGQKTTAPVGTPSASNDLAAKPITGGEGASHKGSTNQGAKGGVAAVDDLLAAANKPYNASSEQSVLARAWDKHSGRPGGTFEPLKGNAAEKNAASEAYLRDLLNNPGTTRTDLSRGGFEYRLPNGQGVRFNADGSFNTLLDPRKP
jgi:filamentous hemagglutinin